MAQVNLNIDELKGFINHIIKNNRFLQKDRKNPVAVEVVGESGIGKTSVVLDLAKDNNLGFVKLNLAQIEELGDLVGFPVRQFQMYTEKKINKKIDDLSYTTAQRSAASANIADLAITKKVGQWVDELAVEDYLRKGWQIGKTGVSYF